MAVGVTGQLAQTKVDLCAQSSWIDFTLPTLTNPARSAHSLPTTCSAGDMLYRNGAAMYYCPTANAAQLETVSGNPTSGDSARLDANRKCRRWRGDACSGGPNFQQAFTSATSVTLAHNRT
jgi:hypothetical protein